MHMCEQYEVCYANFILISYRIRSDTLYKLAHHKTCQSLELCRSAHQGGEVITGSGGQNDLGL